MDNGLKIAQIIVDIIKTHMNLDSQLVFIENKNHNIDTTANLQVTVRPTEGIVISSTSHIHEDSGDVYERSAVTVRQNVVVDIMSAVEGVDANNDAMSRRWEVIAALGSIYSQQKQNQHDFKILKIPNSFLDTSAAEGGSQLNRYTLSFATLVCYKKDTLLSADSSEYYDSFGTRVDDEDTIGGAEGLFEFTIDENTEL